MTVQLSPIAVEVEYIRAERRSRRVLAQWIVDPDEKLRHLLRKRNRAALRTITKEELPGIVENLRGEDAGTGGNIIAPICVNVTIACR